MSYLKLRKKIHEQSPLILNLTNTVTMDFIANGLLSLGAAPVMSESLEDTRELMQIVNAIVINMGTINDNWFERILKTCEIANSLPVIFDPVGAGATQYRTRHAKQLLDTQAIDIVRGNASEIMALANHAHNTRGVNATENTLAAVESAKYLASQYNLTVVVSGPTDIIVNSKNIKTLTGGSDFMPLITGTGCLLNTVIAAFAAVHNDHFEAAYAACHFYSDCGEAAAQDANGPGSFKTNFIDALYA